MHIFTRGEKIVSRIGIEGVILKTKLCKQEVIGMVIHNTAPVAYKA